MTAVLLTAFCSLALLLGGILWLVWAVLDRTDKQFQELTAAHEQALDKMQELAVSALGHIKAASVQEHVEAQARKEAYDLQLEMLRDTYAKEDFQHKQKVREEYRAKVMTEQGDHVEVDLNDYEVLG